MKILLLRDRFSHMGQHSGYDQICLALSKIPGNEYTSFWRKKKVPFASFINLIKRKFKSHIHSTPFYGLPSLYLEIQAAWRAYFNPTDAIHILYLEDTLGFLPYLRKHFFSKTKLIATAHQPPSWWKINRLSPYWLDALDGLIVLDSASRNFFTQYVNPEKIHIIHHGVDTTFFYPLLKKSYYSPLRCLFVGQWLRDFSFLEKVVRQVHLSRPDIKFDLVFKWKPTDSLDTSMIRMAQNQSVHFHTNLTDLQLQRLYQNASFLILPLLDSTANNAILEAMASGLPILTTSVGGVQDYLPTEGAFVFESEQPQLFAETLLSLIDNTQVRDRLGKAVRMKAQNAFDWKVIASETLKLYSKISS